MLELLMSLAFGGDPTPLLESELARATAALAARAEPPYYVALAVTEHREVTLSARDGALAAQDDRTTRTLDVDLRVGSPELDSTHPLRGFSALDGDDRAPIPLPIEEEPDLALRHAVWREIDRAYREAAERIVMIRSNRAVLVEEEDPAPDFAPGSAHVGRVEAPRLDVDPEAWATLLVALSTELAGHPGVQWSYASLEASRDVTTLVDTEGSRLSHGALHARFALSTSATLADGDEIGVYDAIDVANPGDLPDADALHALVDSVLARHDALAAAPRGEPYSGPVILSGRAAGVFVHEVLGHRVEGHRQKREDEGKTFADQVGRPILPPWIDIYDDPTIRRLEGVDLNGYYVWDDEGTAPSRAVIVDDGIFRGFLMSRSPIDGFSDSNGHGRRSPGRAPTARMGNTIVETTKSSSMDDLRKQLVAELKRQGLPYGYVVDEIDGGFTLTGRVTPNAFNVRASSTIRIYADGRPDEVVRGIDLVGTPLVAFSNVIAAGDRRAVFNGVCGAESGWVPVSAVAPPLLFRRLEFQLKEKGDQRPPLLVKPSAPPVEEG